MATRASSLTFGILLLGCSAASEGPGPEPGFERSIPTADGLSGCKGKASSSIPSSGTFVLTTFGGPGDSQPLACGGSSKSGSWYYAASRQRYGCGGHVEITANGKCVVARTDDYGPDVCVENAAGSAVMDVSPLVAKELFGVSELGWSDEKKVHVELVSSSTPLGPCTAAPPPGGGGSGGSSGAGGGSGSGPKCSSDGECNPGNDGSGLICQSGSCVAGCHSDAQCPGVTHCVSGSCQGASGSGGSGPGGAGSGGASGGGGGSPGGGGAGGGGQSCASDGECNPGSDGSGLICVSKVCVPGCHQSWQCPGNTTCKSGQCK
jgi:hypothetical protein